MRERLNGFNYPYSQKVLPLVYDDALSYYEQVCKLVDKVNDVINYVNNLETEFLDKANAYADKRYEDSIKYTDNKVSSWEQKLADLQNNFDDLEAELSAKYIELEQGFGELYQAFNTHRNYVNERFTLMYADLEKYIDEHIATITQLYVKSPVDGKVKDITIVLREMWNSTLAVGALSAREYDSLLLTASEYDGRMIMAGDYDSRLRVVMHEELYMRMRSPFDGKLDTFKHIINKLADLHKEGITARAYDNKMFTATEYDNRQLTAYDYDWQGDLILG